MQGWSHKAGTESSLNKISLRGPLSKSVFLHSMPAIEDFISTTLKLQADAVKQFERLSKLVLRIDRKEQYVLTRALSRLVRGHLAIFRSLRAHLHALAITKVAIPLPPFESEFIEPETQSAMEETSEKKSPAALQRMKNESKDSFPSAAEVPPQQSEYLQEPMAHALALSTVVQSVTLAPMALQLSSRIQTEVMDRLSGLSSRPSSEPTEALASGTSGVQYDKSNLEAFGISQSENSVSPYATQETAAPSYFSSPLYSLVAISSAASLPTMIFPYPLSGLGPNYSSSLSPMRFASTTVAKEILPLSISNRGISRYIQPSNSRNSRITSIASDLSDFERPSILENSVLALLTAGAGISALNVFHNVISLIQPSRLLAPFYLVMQGLTNASYIYPQSTGGESTSSSLRPEGSSFQGTGINRAQVTSPVVATTMSQNGPRHLNYAESILPMESNSETTLNALQSDANRTARAFETTEPFSSLATPSTKETPIEKVEQKEAPIQYEEEQDSFRSYFAPVLMLASSGLSFPLVQILNWSLGKQRSRNYAGSILQIEPSLKTESDLGENYFRPPAREELATFPISGATSPSQGTPIEKLPQSLPSEQKIPDALYQDRVSAPSRGFSGYIQGSGEGVASLFPAFIIANAVTRQASTAGISLNNIMTRSSRLLGSSILGHIGSIGRSAVVLNRFLATSSQVEQPILESVSPNFEPAPRVSAVPAFSAEPSLRSRVEMSHVPLAIPGQRLGERSPQLPEERKHPLVKVQGIYDSNVRVVKTSEEEEIELRELRRKMATILEEEFRRSYGGS